MANAVEQIDDQGKLATWLSNPANEGRVVRTYLKTSDRVIARVTDGIYRQPSSALRELISNAWDADAKNVTILTDAPRFSRIYIRDDGVGMSHDVLARLLHNIGGSAKRHQHGRELGVTSDWDLEKSPGGRPLIGKIGIGLFSVSQLARRFQVITKVAGSNHRLVAEVKLRAYSEDGDYNEEIEAGDDSYVSGIVSITPQYTDDLDAHGTDIILDDVKPRVRDLLRSADRWRDVDETEAALDAGEIDSGASKRVEAPIFHSGWIAMMPRQGEPAVLDRPAHFPWSNEDPPEARMGKLMDGVESLSSSKKERPDLASTLDSYLEMIWQLGLSAPVEYVDAHPFDLKQSGDLRLFWLSNESRGRSIELPFASGQTVRAAVKEHSPGKIELKEGLDPVGGFKVNIDGTELRRPIRFKFYRTERSGIEQAMLFVGKYAPNLAKIPAENRGGKLSFESYLFWTGRVIPKENNGVLIRIRGASGALFDQTFFKYQVSEQTRLRQIISELFIQSGMDAALNIDRESFNYAHPHVQIMTLWLHGAIRQLTNRHKEESAKLRNAARREQAGQTTSKVLDRAELIWRQHRTNENVPDIIITKDEEEAGKAREQGFIALNRSSIPTLSSSLSADTTVREAQAAALTTILSAFGLLEDRSYEEQQQIVEAILSVFYEQ
ncbi:MAG: ATP-binding protein [Rhizobiales bacterium]|nr:ATP-binding protein [Hyphomicrobiales bacterium]